LGPGYWDCIQDNIDKFLKQYQQTKVNKDTFIIQITELNHKSLRFTEDKN